MKTMNLGRTNLSVPVIGLGCMRITELGNHQNVRKLIDTAMEQGINFLIMRIFMPAERQSVFLERL